MNAIQAVAQNILHAQGFKSLKIGINSNAIGQVIEYVRTCIPSEAFQESLLYDSDTRYCRRGVSSEMSVYGRGVCRRTRLILNERKEWI